MLKPILPASLPYPIRELLDYNGVKILKESMNELSAIKQWNH
ncbi:hypothetical protein Nhal_3907 [Nitrosococcus halophilus Nc 4]|uniref:Uncharacterized protein n=1 Tax=Nitrosococcus halophilus (strain Nc4) TaxID=472759 RepID=D5C3Y2_NITHN|nr:hypothetical protein Nhal_3907 [Nitrosococcus halophilus Nc 4]